VCHDVCLEKATKSKIVTAVESLPDKGDIKKMRGPGPPNTYWLRVGRYRVFFLWEDDVIRVVDIDTR
jgi:mRNA-degrading endonuclease RelE of RelBE toxin-antitoxin system